MQEGRIEKTDTHTQTHRTTNCNPPRACAPRVKNSVLGTKVGVMYVKNAARFARQYSARFARQYIYCDMACFFYTPLLGDITRLLCRLCLRVQASVCTFFLISQEDIQSEGFFNSHYIRATML